MKLPPLKRLFDKDLAPLPEWFRPMLILVNSFFQNVWQALNGQLTFADNIKSQMISVNYVADSELAFSTSLSDPVQGVLVLQIGGAEVVGGVTVVWQQVEKTIKIQQITGLTGGALYTLRLLLI